MNVPFQTTLVTIDLDDKYLTRYDRTYPNLKYLTNNVILLYVLESSIFNKDDERNELIAQKNTQLNELASGIQKSTGLNVKAVIQTGKPAEEILKATTSYNINLIGMSTHTHSDENHTLKNALGSTTNHVVRESKVPVFTFNSNVVLNKIIKILLPLDMTMETRQKVTNAIQLAKSLHATIAIVSVLQPGKSKDIKDQLKKQLMQVKEFIEQAEIPCTTELIESEKIGVKSITNSILNFGDEEHADLIMVMTQQESRLAEFFVGSAAQTILRLSRIPVLSIIPKKLGFVIVGA